VPLLNPAWAARLAAFNELTFPVLIIIGFATRLAAATRHDCGDPDLRLSSGVDRPLVVGSILVLLLSRGAGALSIDYLIEQGLARRAAA
jgi:putative oxidoreductase